MSGAEAKGGVSKAALLACLGIAGVFYLIALPFAFIDRQRNPEDGMLVGFGIMAQFVVWAMLAIFLLLASHRAGYSVRARFALATLWALAAYAAISTLGWMGLYTSWIRVTPLLLPPAAAAFGLWAQRSRESAAERRRLLLIFGGAVLLLCVPPVVDYVRWLGEAPEREAVRLEEEREAAALVAEVEARFRALGPETPMEAYLRFVNEGGLYYEEALAALQRSPRRQGDAVRLLAAGQLDSLEQMSSFQLEPTPELCRSYRSAIERRMASYQRNRRDQWYISADMHDQTGNLAWFHANGCDLSEPLRRLIAMMRPAGTDMHPDAFIAQLEPMTRPPTPQPAAD